MTTRAAMPVRDALLRRTWLGRREALLLQAGLLDGDAGRQAWAELAPLLGPPTDQHWAAIKQIPLLLRNLERLGIPDPWGGRMRIIRNGFWARTQQRLGAAEGAAGLLRDAGIPVMLLKGSALVASGCMDPAVRPMDDADILVPVGRVSAAIAALGAGGWQPHADEDAVARAALETGTFTGRCMTLVRSVANATVELDLHQFASHFDLRATTDDGMWTRAREGRLGRTPVLVPCVEDQILLIATHRASKVPDSEKDEMATMRWLSDCAFLLRSSPESLDWELIVRESIRRQVGVLMAESFAVLNDLLGPHVPEDVIRTLWEKRRPLEARWVGLLRTDYRALGPVDKCILRFNRFRRQGRADLFDAPVPVVVAQAIGLYARRIIP